MADIDVAVGLVIMAVTDVVDIHNVRTGNLDLARFPIQTTSCIQGCCREIS